MPLTNLTTEHSTNLILDDLATRNDNWTVLDDIVTAVPSSGAAGQVLAMVDATDYNTGWVAVSTVGANAKNKIINGNFDIWQRGTSFSATGTARYLADRWYSAMLNTTQAVSRQAFTVGQTDVPYEPAYFHRSVVASAAAAGNYARLSQRIESVKTFAGQTVTLSFYAKADAAKNIAVEFVQNFGAGGSPSADVTTIGTVKKALTTGWVKQTVTVAIPSISGKTLGTTHDGYLAVVFWFDAGSDFNARTDTLGQQSGTFDIAQVQVEAGSFATPFEKRLIGAELALCQRYYEQNGPVASGTYYPFAAGFSVATTLAYTVYHFAVPKKTAGYTLVTTGTAADYWFVQSGTGYALTSVPDLPAGYQTTLTAHVNCTVSGATLTVGNGGLLKSNNNATTFLGFDAEL